MRSDSRPTDRPFRKPGGCYAALDVGSNTVRALAARMEGQGTLTVTHQAGRMTALGRGVAATGRLERGAITATARFVADFLRRASPLEAVFCVGTAAAREAQNVEALREALQRRAGVTLEVISGEEEARLAYQGAVALRDLPPGVRPLVADLGGKSLELARPRGSRLQLVSLPLGARSLTETYLRAEQPARRAIAAARQAARAALAAAQDWLASAQVLVATGGTAFAAVQLAGGRWELSATALRRLRRRLARMTMAERRVALSFDPARAEVICGGLIVLEILAEEAQSHRLLISPGGLREGLLLERTGSTRLVFPEGPDRLD